MKIPGYQIIRRIGSGGMANIYLAVQEGLGRDVAIKVVHTDQHADQEAIDRFTHEAQTIAKLDHPQIVTIFDIGQTDDGSFYYSMPYMNRGDLSTRRISDELEIIDLLCAVLEGLSFAHERGVVHRDLKPENILFDQNGRPQIADFGIAISQRSDFRITKEGQTIGSVHYMSPEQARSKQVDLRSDLYSLGSVLFELLTGDPPFDADDEMGIMLAHVNDPIPRLPQPLSHWQSIIDRAMAKRPQDRFQSAPELIEALGELKKQIQAENTAILRTIQWFKDRKHWVPGIVAASLLAILVWWIWNAGDPRGGDFVVPSDQTATRQSGVRNNRSDAAAQNPGVAIDALSSSELDARIAEGYERVNAGDIFGEEGAVAQFSQILVDVPNYPEAVSGLQDAGRKAALDEETMETIRNLEDTIAKPLVEGLEVAVGEKIGAAAAAGDKASAMGYLENLDALGVESERVSIWRSQVAAWPESGSVKTLDKFGKFVLVPEVSGSKSYWVGAHEITTDTFAGFVLNNEYQDPDCRPAQLFGERTWRDPGFDQSPDHPVVCINWDAAKAFARWAGDETGMAMDIPTKSQWLRIFSYSGQSTTPSCGRDNLAGPEVAGSGITRTEFECDDGAAATAKIGNYTESNGISDLVGNVAEWAIDCKIRESNCEQRAVMGLSWFDGVDSPPIEKPRYLDSNRGYYYVGIRLVAPASYPFSAEL